MTRNRFAVLSLEIFALLSTGYVCYTLGFHANAFNAKALVIKERLIELNEEYNQVTDKLTATLQSFRDRYYCEKEI